MKNEKYNRSFRILIRKNFPLTVRKKCKWEKIKRGPSYILSYQYKREK